MVEDKYTKVRRKDRALTPDEALLIADKSSYAVLSLSSVDGTPYGVPINVFRYDNCFYFHCKSNVGRKIDLIKQNNKVSLCFVCFEKVDEVAFSTDYASTIVQGTIAEVTDDKEKLNVAVALCQRFAPFQNLDAVKATFEKYQKATAFYKITPDFITGKSRNFAKITSNS